MMMPDLLLSLRELLHETPSQALFFKLFSLFEGGVGADSWELALDYASSHLDGWDDAFRMVRPEQLWPNGLDAPASQWSSLARRLQVSGRGGGNAYVTQLAKAPALADITQLHLAGNKLGLKGSKALAHSPYLESLKELNLNKNKVEDHAMKLLAESEVLTNLETLLLDQNYITAIGVEAFVCSANALMLKQLSMRSHCFAGKDVAALAHAEALVSLQSLDIAGCGIGDLGARMLSGSRALPELTWLNVTDNQLTHEGVEALAHSVQLAPSLRGFLLSGNPIGDKGARVLASATMPCLEKLYLGGCGLTDKGVKALVRSPVLAQVRELSLASNQLSSEGAKAIATSEYLRHLTHLDLGGNQIGNEGAKAIARSKHLRGLRELELNDMGNGGNKSLGFSRWMPQGTRRHFLARLPLEVLQIEAHKRGFDDPFFKPVSALLDFLSAQD